MHEQKIEVPNMVWAFNRFPGMEQEIYNSLKNDGKARYAWAVADNHNLLLENNWSEFHSKNRFLLQIQPGDWIVYINTPFYGRCTAVKVISDYDYDKGLLKKWDGYYDLRHFFQIDKESIIEFDRRDPNVLPTVNLKPRSRYHRVYDRQGFIKSIENLRNKAVNLKGKTREIYHLREDTNRYLREITSSIQKMHKSKALERFFCQVFEKIPNVVSVKANGFGWKSDDGADLIVDVKASIGNMDLDNKITVQIKSYTGDHNDLGIVDDTKRAIKQFQPSGAIMITTANATENLENKVDELRNRDDIDIPIELIAGEDVAKFVLKYAPDLVFNLDL